ncbi:MAG: hypothetical protein ACOCV2_13690 [Persicimonas sp.]
MIRVLIIGREGASWAEGLAEYAGEEIELDHARLPAAGLRQLEKTPPDALVVVETAADRAHKLVAAVRERPVGQLIPIAIVAPPPTDQEAERVEAWLSPDTPLEQLVDMLEEALEVGLASEADEATPAPPKPPRERTSKEKPTPSLPKPRSRASTSGAGDEEAPEDAPAEEPAYYIEEIEDEPQGSQQVRRDSLFSTPRSSRESEAGRDGVDREEIERKLKAVRHEDYFSILEVRRGADSTVIREAFHRLTRRFDADRVDFELAHQLEDELAEIQDALEDAWAVLGDPKLREAYLEHTTKK